MVNHGVSRGCETCRQRRKKCDEGRPTCNRCAKAGRVCQGYRSHEQLVFRHYTVAAPLSAPKTDQPITEPGVALFLADYVVQSTDTRVSRGFLAGLPPLLANGQPSSHITQATEIVAWASAGNRFNQPDLHSRVKTQYISRLRSFQGLLFSCQVNAPTGEALAIAILLEHVAHVRGVCALLLSPNPPFNLLSSTRLFQVANPLLVKQDQATQVRLDDFLANSWAPLSEFQQILAQALTIEHAFSCWDTEKDCSWNSTTVGYISQADAEASSSLCPFVASGPMHSYFDVYVAAVMNTYRKTYLLLLDVLLRLVRRKARAMINGIIASVTYHLVNHPEDQPPQAGRPVGGILLLHPLYVLSTCSIVPACVQWHARICLSWIGEHMGIGQAAVMSTGHANIQFQRMAEGHVLIWAGMLLQQTHAES
ncbi:hypothetical protein BDW62DRAFT_219950 [Aspergillus aurantiobrunneus]